MTVGLPLFATRSEHYKLRPHGENRSFSRRPANYANRYIFTGNIVSVFHFIKYKNCTKPSNLIHNCICNAKNLFFFLFTFFVELMIDSMRMNLIFLPCWQCNNCTTEEYQKINKMDIYLVNKVGVENGSSQTPGASISYRWTTHFVLRNVQRATMEEIMSSHLCVIQKIPWDRYSYSYNSNQSETSSISILELPIISPEGYRCWSIVTTPPGFRCTVCWTSSSKCSTSIVNMSWVGKV